MSWNESVFIIDIVDILVTSYVMVCLGICIHHDIVDILIACYVMVCFGICIHHRYS